jgi:carbonic anhydrase/acetyltransferase-like protein (isoleucine patch superfamily)
MRSIHPHDFPYHPMCAGFYQAENATVVGDVTIGATPSLWFNVVVRGDVASIRIGRRVNVQDASIIHVDTGVPQVIEDEVSIGHRAIVHGKLVGRGALIGMGADRAQRMHRWRRMPDRRGRGCATEFGDSES